MERGLGRASWRKYLCGASYDANTLLNPFQVYTIPIVMGLSGQPDLASIR